jgi:phage-related protein
MTGTDLSTPFGTNSSAGNVTSYTVTIPNYPGHVTGAGFFIQFNATSNANPTLTVSGVAGAVTITDYDGQALITGAIQTGDIWVVGKRASTWALVQKMF